jgi:hypothetical protein
MAARSVRLGWGSGSGAGCADAGLRVTAAVSGGHGCHEGERVCVCERERDGRSTWLWPSRSHSAAVTQAGPARCKLHAKRGCAQHTQHSSTCSSQHSVLALLRCLFACRTRAGAAASAGPFATAHLAAGLLLEGYIECARGLCVGGLARGRGAAAGVGHRGATRSVCPIWPVAGDRRHKVNKVLTHMNWAGWKSGACRSSS